MVNLLRLRQLGTSLVRHFEIAASASQLRRLVVLTSLEQERTVPRPDEKAGCAATRMQALQHSETSSAIHYFSHPWRRLGSILGLLLGLVVPTVEAVQGNSAELEPGTPSVVDMATQRDVTPNVCTAILNLPAGTKVTVDGTEYGTKRDLNWSNLVPGRTYVSKLGLRFPDSTNEVRSLLVEGGRHLTLSEIRPGATRPELVLQTGHLGSIESFCTSNDGRWMVTWARGDQTAILWNIQNGQQLRRFNQAAGRGCFPRNDHRWRRGPRSGSRQKRAIL